MQPDLKAIGRKLNEAQPIETAIDPFAAYCLVPLLQLALRHPRLKVEHQHSYNAGKQIAQLLQQRLSEIDPAIAQSLEAGWDESLDMSDAEYKQFSRTDDLPQRNYSQLREDIQEEVIANSVALGIACQTLAQHVGGSQEAWVDNIMTLANSVVDQMSKTQIKQAIAQIDFHRDFTGGPPQ